MTYTSNYCSITYHSNKFCNPRNDERRTTLSCVHPLNVSGETAILLAIPTICTGVS